MISSAAIVRDALLPVWGASLNIYQLNLRPTDPSGADIVPAVHVDPLGLRSLPFYFVAVIEVNLATNGPPPCVYMKSGVT